MTLAAESLATSWPNCSHSKFWQCEAWAASNRARQFLIDLYRRHAAENPHAAFRVLAVVRDREQNDDQRRLNILLDAAQPFPHVAKYLRTTTASEVAAQSIFKLFDLSRNLNQCVAVVIAAFSDRAYNRSVPTLRKFGIAFRRYKTSPSRRNGTNVQADLPNCFTGWRVEESFMLRWALVFLLIALVAGVLGLYGLQGMAMWFARVLFLIFIVLFIVSLAFGRRIPPAA